MSGSGISPLYSQVCPAASCAPEEPLLSAKVLSRTRFWFRQVEWCWRFCCTPNMKKAPSLVGFVNKAVVSQKYFKKSQEAEKKIKTFQSVMLGA